MERLHDLFEEASAEAPPPGFTLDHVTAVEDRRRIRYRIGAGAGTIAGVAALVVGMTALVGGIHQPANRGGAASPGSPVASHSPSPVPSPAPSTPYHQPGLTELYHRTVTGLHAAVPHATFSWVALRAGRHDAPFTYYPSQGGFKSAGILNDQAGKSYLFLDVQPTGQSNEPPPDAHLSPGSSAQPNSGTASGAADCPETEGYTVLVCDTSQQADGTVVNIQSAREDNGVITYAVNVLRPNGVGVTMIENNYSEADQPPAKNSTPHSQRKNPTLSLNQLTTLGIALSR